VIIPVFGIIEIIAHFKIGMQDWIHIALVSTNIQVSRKASMFFFLINKIKNNLFQFAEINIVI
jgi:hypothetical protein